MSDTLDDFLRQLKRIGPAMVDCYVVVDDAKKIVDFNRAFFAMLPREATRGLRGRQLGEVVTMKNGDNGDVIEQCWKQKQPVRFNDFEIEIPCEDDDLELKVIISSIPVTRSDEEVVGAFVVIRDMSERSDQQKKLHTKLELVVFIQVIPIFDLIAGSIVKLLFITGCRRWFVFLGKWHIGERG